jgi:hypothetical protein
MFPVVRCKGRQEVFQFYGYLVVEGGCCALTGVGQHHVQCTPVAVHGRSLGQAAPLDPVHQAGERRLLHAEAVCQFGHSPRPLRHDA